MLNHFLAVVLELGGLSLFLSGFFLPEMRRKSDFAWSGVALLYALVLWIEGDHTSSGALLGHIASVALILWFGWQTVQQRRQFSAPDAQTAIPSSLETLTPFLKKGWGQIIVAYGETAAWVQDKLGQENADVLPQTNVPPAPLQDSIDEDWENENASSPSSAAISEPPLTEAIEEQQREATPLEVPVEPPPSETELKVDLGHEQPEISPAPTPIETETESISSPVTAEQSANLDLEHSARSTVMEPTTTEIAEASHDNPQEGSKEERVAEPTASLEVEDNALDAEGADENVHTSAPENDDEWPPRETMT
jgi:Ycf66 protein N-terminus